MADALPDGGSALANNERDHDALPKIDFNDVFSLRKPRDARAGLSSGLKSMAKGVLGGAVGLVAAPLLGASEGGVKGFATGLIKGMAGAVVLPVTGLGIGTVQMIRGVVNQPEALIQSSRGKVWDMDQREWSDAPDGTLVTSADARKARAGLQALRKADGLDYYQLLQVPRCATLEDIKKQYYKLARQWHPDKNPGDQDAHVRFQQLGEAYQVLANDELRTQYDRHGSVDANFMDSGEFFTMLFGGDLFDDLVGELVIASAARSGGELSSSQMRLMQAQRVERLVLNLSIMLKRSVLGDEEGFKIAMRQEAERLASASFGETLIHVVGRAYELSADCYLGNFFTCIAAKVSLSADTLRTQLAAAGAALKVFQAQQRLEDWQRRKDAKATMAAAAAAKEAAAAAAAAALAAGAPSTNLNATAASSGADSVAGSAPGGSTSSLADAAAVHKTSEESGPTGSTGQPLPRPRLAPQAGASVGGASSSGSTGQAPDTSAADLLEKSELEDAALPLMLDAMWAANVMDITTTLRKALRQVLEDPKARKSELRARAIALKECGRIFQEARAPAAAGGAEGGTPPAAPNARQQMEDAMNRVLDKRLKKQEAHYEADTHH